MAYYTEAELKAMFGDSALPSGVPYSVIQPLSDAYALNVMPNAEAQTLKDLSLQFALEILRGVEDSSYMPNLNSPSIQSIRKGRNWEVSP